MYFSDEQLAELRRRATAETESASRDTAEAENNTAPGVTGRLQTRAQKLWTAMKDFGLALVRLAKSFARILGNLVLTIWWALVWVPGALGRGIANLLDGAVKATVQGKILGCILAILVTAGVSVGAWFGGKACWGFIIGEGTIGTKVLLAVIAVYGVAIGISLVVATWRWLLRHLRKKLRRTAKPAE